MDWTQPGHESTQTRPGLGLDAHGSEEAGVQMRERWEPLPS